MKQTGDQLTFELSSDVRHFLIYSFLLKFLDATRPNVCDELYIHEDEYLHPVFQRTRLACVNPRIEVAIFPDVRWAVGCDRNGQGLRTSKELGKDIYATVKCL
jgi:hypothetical protein